MFLYLLFILAQAQAISSSHGLLQTFLEKEHATNTVPIDVAADSTCTISASESCPISGMSSGQSTLVYPGGKTRCIKHTSSPFAFQVVPRDLTKVHIHLQGGGACWDAATTWVPLCSTSVGAVNLNSGVFNANNADNPYKDYTVIAVLYCSGDVHAGNVTRSYDDEPNSGYPTVQVGAENVMATLEWLRAQNLGVFEDLVLSGSSAGAMGLQPWANYLLPYFQYKHASIIIDSYAGVVECMGPLITRFGMCNTVLVDSYPTFLQQKCVSEALTLEDVVPFGLLQDPRVVWTFLQSKEDAVQIEYYIAVGALCLEGTPTVTPQWFYAWVNEILELYRWFPNFQLFYVDSSQHTYLPNNHMYSATTTSANGGSGPTMLALLKQQQASANTTVTSQCDGSLENRQGWSGLDYCDDILFPNAWNPSATAHSEL